MSARWREATRAAPAAPPLSTRCQPRNSCGGADPRLVMRPAGASQAAATDTITGFARPKGDGRVYGGMRPLTGGAGVPLLSVSGPIGGLETLLSSLRLPLPPALAAESLRPLGYNPHKECPGVMGQPLSTTAFYPS